MKSLTCLYDTQNEKYLVYHSALLVFVLTVVIPINLQLTKLPFYVTGILFAAGFLSMFMIARNDKVGFGLLKSLRIEKRANVVSQKIANSHSNSTDDQDPIVLMQNFVNELSKRQHEEMDWTELDSFRMLNARLTQLVGA